MIKVLYDIEQLLSAKGKETGICRVSLEVLKELNQRPDYEVYPLVTIKDKCAAEYLKNKGLESLVGRIVYLPYLKKTTKCYNWRQKIKSALLMRCLGERYKREIDKYDEYISIFSPISGIVYDSHVHTKIFVHDLIPIKFPEFISAKFAVKYKKWMAGMKADEVFCISHSTRKDFLAERPDYDERKVKVVYLAADAKFKPTSSPDIREKYGIKTKKYFLAVSELTERKNFEHLVKAFLRFLNESKAEDVSLAIIGVKRAGYEALNRLVAEQKSHQDKIVLTGFVADEDMAALYSQTEVFIYPSLYEGFGLPVLEAMQCGTAVVCSDNSSLPEVGGDAVQYISGHDEAETARVLSELYYNDTLKEKLQIQGLERAKLFGWKCTVDEIFK